MRIPRQKLMALTVPILLASLLGPLPLAQARDEVSAEAAQVHDLQNQAGAGSGLVGILSWLGSRAESRIAAEERQNAKIEHRKAVFGAGLPEENADPGQLLKQREAAKAARGEHLLRARNASKASTRLTVLSGLSFLGSSYLGATVELAHVRAISERKVKEIARELPADQSASSGGQAGGASLR